MNMKKKFRLVLDFKTHIKEEVRVKEPERPVISFLLTCYLYFFDCVFILKDGGLFCLVVNHRGQVLTLKTYRTLAGAKTAFSHSYRQTAFKSGIKNQWSHFYPPEKQWLKKKMSGKSVRARHAVPLLQQDEQ
jgi:hypothetical protein